MTFDADRRRLAQSIFKNGLPRGGGNDGTDEYLQLTNIVTNDSSSVFFDLGQILLWSYM